ncbi:MAG TPA: SGNH/GDSL hydrolase family protein [Candidatus Binatia bacterium]|nr:SGNH/GDSL hydrolase family protein [Candidatus Binatia bacterium]
MTPLVSRRSADVVIVGDSLTVGEHASERHRGYAPLVVDSLRAAVASTPLSVRVIGVSGSRVGDFARRALPSGKRLVVLELGTNDWLGYRRDAPWEVTPLAEFRSDYGRLLDRLLGRLEPALVCLGVWGPEGGRGGAVAGPGGGPGVRTEEFDRVIRAECSSRGGEFVPLAALRADPTTCGPAGRWTPFGISDEGHPNDRGHALIAAALLAACSATVRRGRPGAGAPRA